MTKYSNVTEVLPCPFCGGECDPEGWLGTAEDPNVLNRGPECESCGATAMSVAEWNRRVPPEVLGQAQAAEPVAEGHRVMVYRGHDGALWVRPTDGRSCPDALRVVAAAVAWRHLEGSASDVLRAVDAYEAALGAAP